MNPSGLYRHKTATCAGVGTVIVEMPPIPRLQTTGAVRQMGRGASAIVYASPDNTAIKVFDGIVFALPELAILKYIKDMQIPNVLTFESTVITGGMFGITMPLGKPATDVIDQKMPMADMFLYAMCLIRAVKALHEAGVVHRDIKPANTLCFPRKSGSERFVLADLGAATILNPVTVVAGDNNPTTINFKDPVMCGQRGAQKWVNQARPEGDVYSLGVTLVYALTGGQYVVRTANRSLDIGGVNARVVQANTKAFGTPVPFPPKHKGETAAQFTARRMDARKLEARRIFNHLAGSHVHLRKLLRSSVPRTRAMADALLSVASCMLIQPYALRVTAARALGMLQSACRSNNVPAALPLSSPKSSTRTDSQPDRPQQPTRAPPAPVSVSMSSRAPPARAPVVKAKTPPSSRGHRRGKHKRRRLGGRAGFL